MLRTDGRREVPKPTPSDMGRSPNIVLMLGQRRRRWTNIKTMLGERPVSDGIVKDCNIVH